MSIVMDVWMFEDDIPAVKLIQFIKWRTQIRPQVWQHFGIDLALLRHLISRSIPFITKSFIFIYIIWRHLVCDNETINRRLFDRLFTDTSHQLHFIIVYVFNLFRTHSGFSFPTLLLLFLGTNSLLCRCAVEHIQTNEQTDHLVSLIELACFPNLLTYLLNYQRINRGFTISHLYNVRLLINKTKWRSSWLIDRSIDWLKTDLPALFRWLVCVVWYQCYRWRPSNTPQSGDRAPLLIRCRPPRWHLDRCRSQTHLIRRCRLPRRRRRRRWRGWNAEEGGSSGRIRWST